MLGKRETEPPATGEWALPSSHVRGSDGLLTNAQFSDDIEVSLWVFAPHVVEQTSATADQTQQASSRGVVFAVRPHVLSQPVNPLGQDGNLHLRRAGIGVRFSMFADYLGFSLFRDRHSFLDQLRRFLLTSLGGSVPRCLLNATPNEGSGRKTNPNLFPSALAYGSPER